MRVEYVILKNVRVLKILVGVCSSNMYLYKMKYM